MNDAEQTQLRAEKESASEASHARKQSRWRTGSLARVYTSPLPEMLRLTQMKSDPKTEECLKGVPYPFVVRGEWTWVCRIFSYTQRKC